MDGGLTLEEREMDEAKIAMQSARDYIADDVQQLIEFSCKKKGGKPDLTTMDSQTRPLILRGQNIIKLLEKALKR